jgi:hypothetical protein
MKLQDAPDDKLIAAFVKIRDQRAQLKAAYENEDSDNKEKQEKIEAEFLRRFSERGTDSTKANGIGTAYTKIVTSTSVANKDVFFGWILEDPVDRIMFVNAAANKANVIQYRGENQDIPPGLNWAETRTVGFRRA